MVTTDGNNQRCIALFGVYIVSHLDQSIRGYLYSKVIHVCGLSDRLPLILAFGLFCASEMGDLDICSTLIPWCWICVDSVHQWGSC